jgi:hypothetical protein
VQLLDDSRNVAAGDASGNLASPDATGGAARQVDHAGGADFARPVRSLARFLYTSNPFYIISADFVFIGLRMVYAPGGPMSASFALAMSLAAYTLLLATTACVLIRFGRLWDDLRSLLVLVVMMFLAIATSLDDVMAAEPGKGVVGYLAGFLFAVVVTEIVLRAIRLRLPWRYRIPYHGILGLIFLYPIALSPLMGDPDNLALQWSLFGFSPLAGLTVASLLPAARRGRPYVEKNGSPWRWPFYPWALFVVLAVGLGLRSYSLCVSFHYVGGSRTIFGPYFLVPIGLAIGLVLLELGIACGRRGVMLAALVVPVGLAMLSTDVDRDDVVFQQFLGTFIRTLGGSPFFLSLEAAVLVCGYAAARRVPVAWEFLSVGLLALAFVAPGTLGIEDLAPVRALPMGAAGVILASLAFLHRDAWRASFAAGFLVTSLTCGVAKFWPGIPSAPVAFHLALLALLLVGALFDDRLGRLARRGGAWALLFLGLGSASGVMPYSTFLSDDVATGYPLVVAVIAWIYARLMHDRLYLATAAAILAIWMAEFGLYAYAQLRKVLVGVDQVACGLLFFVIAIAISLRKAGLWPKWVRRCLESVGAGWNEWNSARPARVPAKPTDGGVEL